MTGIKNTGSSFFEKNQRYYIGIIFNALFAVYAVLIHAVLSKNLSVGMGEKTTDTFPVMGILVFIVSLAEAPALRQMLLSVLSSDVRGKMTRNRVMIFFGPLFFRTILGLVLALSIFLAIYFGVSSFLAL